MSQATATLFLNNKSQAIRLPKSVAFPSDTRQVTIVALGQTRIVTPVGHVWDAWFAQPADADAALGQREQPEMQKREELEP